MLSKSWRYASAARKRLTFGLQFLTSDSICAFANASISNALAAEAPRNATDPPKMDPSACLLATAEESTFFAGETLYPWAVTAKRPIRREVKVVFMLLGLFGCGMSKKRAVSVKTSLSRSLVP